MLFHGAFLQLGAQRQVRRVVLGDQQHPAGVLVQPVHDAGSLHPADAGQVGDGEQQGIDQRAGFVARRGMHHHAAGLVDHRQILVLIEKLDGNFFFFHGRLHRVGDVRLHTVARVHGRPGLERGMAVDPAKPGCNPSGRLRARRACALRHQQVQPRVNRRDQFGPFHAFPPPISASSPAGARSG